MKKALLALLLISLFLILTSCQLNNTTKESSEKNEYCLDYSVFLEKISNLVGSEEMFSKMEKNVTIPSYDNNFTDSYTLTSIFNRTYRMTIIYNTKSVVSIDVSGDRSALNEKEYTTNIDFITLSQVIYQIINQQTNCYTIMIRDFQMNLSDATVMKTISTQNWIMIYSANNNNISFFSLLKTS